MSSNFHNVLVTGGTGFIGSHLVERLVAKKLRVVSTYRRLDPRSYFFLRGLQHKCVMIAADVNSFDGMFDIVTTFQIDCIFHLAAQPLVEVALLNPRQTLQTNICGTVNLLECARLAGSVRSIVVASSDKAYGKLKKDSYTEDDPLSGKHPYDASKSATDLIAQAYQETYKLPVMISRFGNIYGEGDLNESRIVPAIMLSIIRGEPLRLRSDGKAVRDYIYVGDVVDGYLRLADRGNIPAHTFNFGSRENLSVLQLIEVIEKAIGKKARVIIENRTINEIPRQKLDYSLAQKYLDWEAKSSLADTARKIFSWYKKISKP